MQIYSSGFRVPMKTGDIITTSLHLKNRYPAYMKGLNYICAMEFEYRLEKIEEAAQKLLSEAGNYKVWAFDGEMGSGKTTLIHTICNILGVKGTFGSPTFSIINEYISSTEPVFHIDLYRCKDEEEAVRAGVEDCLYSGNLCMVEWPTKAPGIFPDETLRVVITVTGENSRKLFISNRAPIPL
jgi:tRNA threonylcarbamoyladenosine biosynthesis protein TsaE